MKIRDFIFLLYHWARTTKENEKKDLTPCKCKFQLIELGNNPQTFFRLNSWFFTEIQRENLFGDKFWFTWKTVSSAKCDLKRPLDSNSCFHYFGWSDFFLEHGIDRLKSIVKTFQMLGNEFSSGSTNFVSRKWQKKLPQSSLNDQQMNYSVKACIGILFKDKIETFWFVHNNSISKWEENGQEHRLTFANQWPSRNLEINPLYVGFQPNRLMHIV